MNKQVRIDWKYSGKPDGFFGTGAMPAEQALVWVFGVIATAMIGWIWQLDFHWTWWRYAVAALLTLDVTGGVVANALNSCKRFYHAPVKAEESGLTAFTKNHLAFVALHIHPLIIGLLFDNLNWVYGLFWYLALVFCVLLVLTTPLYLRRPLAMGLIMLAVIINSYLIPAVGGFEWLAPALFLKLVYGHSVREEPYRP